MSNLDDVVILPAMHDTDFASNVVRILQQRPGGKNVQLGKVTSKDFEDSDPYFKIHLLDDEDISGKIAFFLQRYHHQTARAWVESMLFGNAAKNAMVEKTHVIETYTGCSRQEKISKPGEAISMQAKALTLQASGIDTFTTFSIHADAIQGFFDPSYTRFDSIPMWPLFVRVIHGVTHVGERVQNAAPDAGAAKALERILHCSTVEGHERYSTAAVIIHKDRENQGDGIDMGSQSKGIIGDVRGYTVALTDDEVNSAGTICDAARLCKDAGAQRVILAGTHGKYAKDQRGVDKLQDAIDKGYVDTVIVTNTGEIFPKLQNLLDDESYSDKIAVIPVEPMVADIIEGLVTPGKGYRHLFSSRRVVQAYKDVARHFEDIALRSKDTGIQEDAIQFRDAMCGAVLGNYEGAYAAPGNNRYARASTPPQGIPAVLADPVETPEQRQPASAPTQETQ